MLWIALAACSENELQDTAAPEEEAVDLEVAWELEPEELDMGEGGLGEETFAYLSLTNTGETNLLIADVWFENDEAEVDVSVLGSLVMTPGMGQNILVTWSPTEPGVLDETLSLKLGESLAYVEKVEVPIGGTTTGPQIEIDVLDHDMGTVNVGCTSSSQFEIGNRGNEDLVIDSITLTDIDSYDLSNGDGVLAELPVTLEPGDDYFFEIEFVPLSEGDHATTVEVVSNDPVNPEMSVSASGSASIVADFTDTFDVTGQQNVTVMWVVNSEGFVYGSYTTTMWDSMEIFFDQLIEAGPKFRVVAVTETDGSVLGSIDYVDDSMSAAECKEGLWSQVETATRVDNDSQLSSGYNALNNTESWMKEDQDWEDSKLTIIGVNDDADQSGGSYKSWVANYQAWKGDSDDLVISGIHGDHPNGCGGAVAGTTWYYAAELTGGVFLSVCTENWDKHMETLGASVIGENVTSFYLSNDAADIGMTVSVDGIEQSSGWDYNPDLNAIVFETDSMPDPGSVVEVYYIQTGECG